jgi:hypothetical protein
MKLPIQLVKGGKHTFGWSGNGVIDLSAQALANYGVTIGDRLLVIRGSGSAVGFAVGGPIVQEARKHRDLPVVWVSE